MSETIEFALADGRRAQYRNFDKVWRLSQEYNGLEMNKPFMYLQHPSLIGGDVCFKVNFLQFAGNFRNVAQACVGGNQAGAIGRLMWDIEWLPSNIYSMTFGLEASIFDYNHGGNQFTSSKVGLNYGVGFSF